jgi:hypothetical protein
MELGDAPIMKIVAHALNYNFAKRPRTKTEQVKRWR